MTNDKLTLAYVDKVELRLKALRFMHDNGGFSDVVREAQECVELTLKALLRKVGIEVPRVHDVGPTLAQHAGKLPDTLAPHLDEIRRISRALRKDRELSFYGAEDWIPTEQYGPDESSEAIAMAEAVAQWVLPMLKA